MNLIKTASSLIPPVFTVTLTPLMKTAQKLLVYQPMNVVWSILDFKP